MGDEFPEADLDTPTERDLDLAYGSQYLSAADVGERKIKTEIEKSRNAVLKSDDGKERKRIVIWLKGVEKPMVLNSTNKNALVDAFGKNPANWKGKPVGLLTHPVMFAGKPVRGLRLKSLGPAKLAPAAPAPAPKPDEDWSQSDIDPDQFERVA